MKAFKRIAACVVAAATMASVAVTASADYRLNGMNDGNKYCIRIMGLPQTVLNDPQYRGVIVLLSFPCGKSIRLRPLNGKMYCTVMKNEDASLCEELECEYVKFNNGENGFLIYFKPDDEYLAEFMQSEIIAVALSNFYVDESNQAHYNYFHSDGSSAPENWGDFSEITWEALGTTSEPTSSEPTSEPTSSEPTSEPVSEPASEPASTPASEPTASTTENSAAENTTSEEKNNPVTGIGGIGFIAAAAVIAGAAVVAVKKK